MYDWFWVLTRLTYTCWLPHVLRRKRYGDCFTLLCFPDNKIRWVIYQILRILKAMVFPVVMCRCESWTIKKAEPKNWCFQTVVQENDFWESLGQQGYQSSQSSRKSTLNRHWKDWCWSWSSNTLVTWCEELAHWKGLWCWERLRVEGGDTRGWDGWMALSTQWTWVWVSSKRWWRTGESGLLQSMGLQRADTTEWVNKNNKSML